MKRVAILISALLLSWVAAAPASAGAGGVTGSCSSGGTCQVQLEQWIKFSGSYSLSNHNTVANIAPPPCLWNPIGDAITGSEAIIKEWGNVPAQAPTSYQINQSVKKANGLLKNPVDGTWYELPVNPAAGAAGAAKCLTLPLYAWETPGNPPPAVPVPPRTLAQLAFAVLSPPTLGQMTLNPATTSEVNLPTFVQVPVNGAQVTAENHVYVYVTATLGNTTVTVWIESSALNIDPGTSGTAGASSPTRYDDPQVCSTAHNGVNDPPILGSHYTAGQMSATPVNQTIDCGVTYRAPGTYNLQASVGWTACWAQTADTAAPALNWCKRHRVPGAALTGTTVTQAVNVQEVQSVNNG